MQVNRQRTLQQDRPTTQQDMNHSLPVFLQPIPTPWTWPQVLPQTQWVAHRFDVRAFSSGDFDHCAIARPAFLERAVPKRLAHFLAGRVCARAALTELGIDNVPSLNEDGSPRWPAGIVGSITHHDDLAGAVVGPADRWQGLGVDVERMLSDTAADDLSAHVLTCQERRRLHAEQLGMQVTLAFSLKESLFKALYPQVQERFYFDAAELLEWQDGHARLRLLNTLSPRWQAGAVIEGQYAVQNDSVLTLVAIAA